jgi:acetyl/propionyl-CoA carboxylase alpha subunit
MQQEFGPDSLLSRAESPRRKILILGELRVVKAIEARLDQRIFEAIGLDTLWPGAQLPPVVPPVGTSKTSLDQLRALLQRFAELSQGLGVVHPGTSRWAERSELPCIAEEYHLATVSPSPRVLSLVSNRLNCLMDAENQGVPTLLLQKDPVHTVTEVEEFIRQDQLPLVLKAAKGLGSGGLFLLNSGPAGENWKKDLKIWFEELRYSHGEVIVFAENYLDSARQILIPFARCRNGQTQIFPSLDVSLQCRYGKLMQWSPAIQVAPELMELMVQWVHRLANGWDYIGVGAFEFLVDAEKAFLIDALARLNSSFHLWDQIGRTNAVAWQMAILENNQEKIDHLFAAYQRAAALPRLHGASLNILAYDSLLHLPQPGQVKEISQDKTWTPCNLAGKHLEAQIATNYELVGRECQIGVTDSGLVGTVGVISDERSTLVSAVQMGLQEFWVAGTLQTNTALLDDLLSHPWIKEEIFHSGFVDEDFVPSVIVPEELLPVFAAVVQVYLEWGGTPSVPWRWLVGRRSISPQQLAGLDWYLGPKKTHGGISGMIRFNGSTPMRVAAFALSDSTSTVDAECRLESRWLVRLGKWVNLVRTVQMQSKQTGLSSLSCLMTGQVHSLWFRPGTHVPAQEPLILIVSLGHLVPHALSVKSVVLEWKVCVDDFVQVGQILAEIQVYN